MSLWKKLLRGTTDTAPVLPPSVATSSSSTTGCTLKIWENERVIPNPTAADIRAAVASLDDSEIGPRLLLSLNGNANRIELSGTPNNGFALDYHEGVAREGDYFYASRRTYYSAEATIKLLIAFRNGAADWRTMVEWKRLKL